MSNAIHFATDINSITGQEISLSTLCGSSIAAVKYVEGSIFTGDMGNADKVTCRNCKRQITKLMTTTTTTTVQEDTMKSTPSTKKSTATADAKVKEILDARAQAKADIAKAQAILDASPVEVEDDGPTIRERLAPVTAQVKGTAAATKLVAKAGVNSVLDMTPRKVVITTPKTVAKKTSNGIHGLVAKWSAHKDDVARDRLGLKIESH